MIKPWPMAAVGFLIAVTAPLLGQVDEGEGVRLQAAEILEEGKYQRELPEMPEVRATRKRSRGVITTSRTAPPELRIADISALAVIFRALFWAATIALTVVLLFFLVRLGLRRRWGRTEGSASSILSTSNPAASPVRRLAQVEALASQGKYGEAVHLLLLMAVDRFARGGEVPLEESLTSREILRRLRLPEGVKDAFERLVLGTERFLFAQEPVDLEEYQQCRLAFERLTNVPAVGGGPQ